jgi:hypothetical protein
LGLIAEIITHKNILPQEEFASPGMPKWPCDENNKNGRASRSRPNKRTSLEGGTLVFQNNIGPMRREKGEKKP